MTGIILSGGKSIRMGGENKAFLSINGEFVIDRVLKIFKELFDETIIVTNSPLDYLDYDVRIVTDIIKGKAALGGIYTGLFYASSEHCFVSACDMPFLDKRFIEYMISSIKGYDIIVPHASDGLQPLHSIYSKKCIPLMKKLIDRDDLKIRILYKKMNTLTLPTDTIRSFDQNERMFLNINSHEDFKRILTMSNKDSIVSRNKKTHTET
jgi:molybdopterin-guanine dinucleotide biosynthesis protein A